MGGVVFVTVGTTKFEELVKMVDSKEVKEALVQRGYDRLVVQFGKGEHVPCVEPFEGLEQESYRYKPSLKEDFEAASLVISHAGFGCLIESLNLGKAVLAVINTSLMDNHQVEIASQLERLQVSL
jgi:beta-1,4-N-acetylglucosaminyltransferase